MKFSYTNCEKNFPNCIYLTYKKTSEKKDLPLQLLVRSQLHKKERGGKMLVLYFFQFAISDSVKYSVIRWTMSFSDFSKVETLQKLNTFLADKSYIEGYVEGNNFSW